MRKFEDLKIAVAGTGYVGMSMATLLAQHHEVMAVDVIPEKVEKINHRISPIQDDYIEKFFAEKELNLTATLDGAAAYKDADFIIIAAPTNYDPQKNFFDTHHLEDVIDLVLENNPEATIVIKSTIPVGYCRSLYVKYAKKFKEKIDNIARLLIEVEPFETCRVKKIKERILSELAQIKGVAIDQGRLEQEMIYYIEKLDVSEEKQRLANHLKYFNETMDGACGQGKKLGFIAQEMGREINTLGSKSNLAEMQNIVVKMKDELEQIKEQVLNAL